jgi:hypothetical protein
MRPTMCLTELITDASYSHFQFVRNVSYNSSPRNLCYWLLIRNSNVIISNESFENTNGVGYTFVFTVGNSFPDTPQTAFVDVRVVGLLFTAWHRNWCGTLYSAVGMATGYGLDDRRVGVRSPVGGKNFHFSMSSRPTLGPTQPSIQWMPATFSPGSKAAGAWSWPLTSN